MTLMSLPLRSALVAGLALSLAAACTPSSPTASPSPAPAQTDLSLALTGEGLFLVEPESGSTTLLPFGTEMTTVQAAVSEILGDPESVSTNEECPGDPFISATWDEGLVLNADGEDFVGWSVWPDAGSEKFTTLAGVGVGSSRQDLESTYTVTVFESTIGTEFTAGQLAGLLSNPTPEATITDFWAGTVCIFR